MSQSELQQQNEGHHNHHVYPASPAVDSVVSDLWDEFWFVQNCLTDGRPKVNLSFNTNPPPHLPTEAPVVSSASSRQQSLNQHQQQTQPLVAAPRQSMLLRAPSLPPDIGKNQHHRPLAAAAATTAPQRNNLLRAPSLPHDICNLQKQDEEVHASCNITNKKLLRSYSTMQDGVSSNYPNSSCKACIPPPRSNRPPRDFTLEAHWIAPNKASYRHHCRCPKTRVTAFQVKKWKSLTDLEHEEVQGFKDLGFNFDNTQGQLSPVLLKMIPGLNTSPTGPQDDDATLTPPKQVSRPYLSEAWLTQRSAPPVLKWDGRGHSSPAHMKEKLRFWARTVASNVRQEC